MITPVGRCTARIEIRGFTYIGAFVVLSECSRDLILGMNFLHANGAVINFPESTITFSTKQAVAGIITDRHDMALRIVDDGVTVPSRASVFVELKSDAFEDYEGIAEGNVRLLLEKGLCIARGFVHLQNGCTSVLLTIFANERRHLAKGAALAFIEEIAEVTQISTLGKIAHESPATDLPFPVEINQELSATQNDAIASLVREFSDCFATTSKVRQTPVANHRIITDESARPVRQHSYRVSPKEREVIKKQVKEMLDYDVIQS